MPKNWMRHSVRVYLYQETVHSRNGQVHVYVQHSYSVCLLQSAVYKCQTLHITSLFPHSLTTSRSHSSVFHRSRLDLKSLNGYGYVDDVMAVGRLLQNHVA